MTEAPPISKVLVSDARASVGAADDHQQLLGSRLRRLMYLRLSVVTGLFGFALFVESQGHAAAEPATTLYPLVIAAYAFSALYAFAARRVPSLEVFTYLQFAVDALCIGLVILFTGAEESPLTLLFVFNILGAGYLLLLPGGLLVATLDTAVYLGCLLIAWTGVAPQLDPLGLVRSPPWTGPPLEALSVYSNVAFHLVSFYLLAFLAGSLAQKQADTGRALAQTADSLLRLRDMHGRIVQNIDVGLVTVDRDGGVTSFNRAAEQILRFEASDVIGHPVSEVLRGVERRLARTVDAAGGPVHGQTFERWATRRDGKRVYLRTSLSVMRSAAGEPEGWILVFEDRTRLLLMEEQLQREERLAAVGRLAAAIAHEIRNPLASITGCVQVLRSGLDLQEDDAELLGLVEREAARLNDLVTDFLSLARDETPDLRLGHLGPLLTETATLLEGRSPGRLKVSLELADDPELRIDLARMRQVFWNLFNNAAQAMADVGTIKVRSERITPEQLALIASGNADSGYWEFTEVATAGETSPALRADGAALRLTVSDHGDGIPDESLSRVFDPFYTTRSGGTGLGLAIVQRIVHAHGGVISVRSQVGEGTTFAIWLPLGAAPDDGPRTGNGWGGHAAVTAGSEG